MFFYFYIGISNRNVITKYDEKVIPFMLKNAMWLYSYPCKISIGFFISVICVVFVFPLMYIIFLTYKKWPSDNADKKFV